MTWTTLTFAFASRLTATQLNLLQANITAALNGDSGGPQLKGSALQPAAGSYVLGRFPAGYSYVETNNTSYTELSLSDLGSGYEYGSWVSPFAGTVTITLKLALSAAGGTGYARIYKNGAASGTERSTTSATVASYDENITVAVGDTIEIYGYHSTGANSIRAQQIVKSSAPFFIVEKAEWA